jgi:hypothetical protein
MGRPQLKWRTRNITPRLEEWATRHFAKNAKDGAPHCVGGWPTQAGFWLEWGCSHVTVLVRRTELDCPHAMGTNAFSPQRAESFRDFLPAGGAGV